MRRKVAAGVAAVVLGAMLLVGPAGTWLQERELRIAAGVTPDAIYMLAGERDQDRRVEAVVRLIAAGANRAPHAPVVLTGTDRAYGGFERDAGRHLTIGEWAVLKLRSRKADAVFLNGSFNGTDGEMQAFGVWLDQHPAVRRVTLVTSPFHVRRSVWRLRRHLQRPIEITVFLPPEEWRDRAPWTVLAEVGKMARDAAGLANAPLLTRRGWGRVGLGER